MKLCPACQRCYEDTDAVCSYDSTALVPSRHGSRLIAEKYRLDRLLGRGGMGAVYEGTHVDLERPVAIKLLLPDFTADPEALERFRREARAAARLNHPNVADTYDYGSLPDGGAYIVMELIAGETLRERMDSVGQMSFGEAIQIARQVTSGVEAAHRSDITHRDLKPSNIILTRDHDGRMLAKVVDFSVAKLKEGTTSGAALTATGSLIGTPRYMSPEQCADNKADARSDIYSLGVILYEMVAGRAPFEGPTATAIAIKHIQSPPPPVEEFRPDTPEGLRGLIAQSLAKAPSERPQTAQEFATRLDEAARELSPSELEAQPSGAAVKPLGMSSAERRSIETNPQKISHDQETGRTGEPTREDSISVEKASDPPSVQSYAVTAGEQDEEVATKVTSKEAKGAETEGVGKETVAETPSDVSPKAEHKNAAAENNFPLLSEHSKTIPAAPDEATRARATESVDARASGTNLLPYAVAAALVVIVGVGVYMLVFRGAAQRSSSAENQAAATENRNAAGAANRTEDGRTSNQPALSDSNASPSPASTIEVPRDARAELQSLMSQWINATTARDIDRLISFYPPVVENFYLKRNVPRAAVRDEKQRMIEQASSIELETSQPEINLSSDGRAAIMTFRKRWNFRGAQNSTGEVVQELRWIKTKDGWKIVGERDIDVIR
ncbi:MAG: protein kinase [Pyrinomonadaceae bacterium]|nr:protein kinase [Pyrinomonadaceae bacterium]